MYFDADARSWPLVFFPPFVSATFLFMDAEQFSTWYVCFFVIVVHNETQGLQLLSFEHIQKSISITADIEWSEKLE